MVRFSGVTTTAAISNVTYPGLAGDVFVFNAAVSGRDSATNDVASWSFTDGVYVNKSGTGSLVTPNKFPLINDAGTWEANITIDNDDLSIEFNGAAATTVDWIISLTLFTTGLV